MRRGVAQLPLHGGHCPPWLFERMRRLSVQIIQWIAEEYGVDEVLRRLSDPVWFQAFGCVLGFDWHSSGLTTVVCGALKEGMRGREQELGLFVAGGKGAVSRRTPAEIEAATGRGLAVEPAGLQYASRMSAKVDSAGLQDGFDVYHHAFFFTRAGSWAVVQQGMNGETGWARRYHWLKDGLEAYTCEPHAAVCGDRSPGGNWSPGSGRGSGVLNLVARESEQNRLASTALACENPEQLIKELDKIRDRRGPEAGRRIDSPEGPEPAPGPGPMRTVRPTPSSEPMPTVEQAPIPRPGIPRPEAAPLPRARGLHMWRAHGIPHSGRLNKALLVAYERRPENFEQLLGLRGVGPATVRALAMVAEVAHGVPSSFRDPVRYSFAHGGKDGIPYPVHKEVYDHTVEYLERALKGVSVDHSERRKALGKLARWRSSPVLHPHLDPP